MSVSASVTRVSDEHPPDERGRGAVADQPVMSDGQESFVRSIRENDM